MPTGIATKETTTEMETHPATVEIQISDQHYSKLYKHFYNSYSSINFVLFHQ